MGDVFSGIDQLPCGHASKHLTEGCLVLEGGAFRGVYTSGVLDALMEADLNFQCTIGVSAGALNGLNYVSGQIGRSGRINLQYRHDSRYIGLKAYRESGSVIGFRFVFGTLEHELPFDRDSFYDANRRFVAVISNCLTGKAEYFERGDFSDTIKAVCASASMPYVSKPVELQGIPYLDGGCTDKIPYRWAMESGYDKIVVVRTRQAEYRKKPKKQNAMMARLLYRDHPAFAQAFADSDVHYNIQCDELEQLRAQNRVFVISPSAPVTVSRLEGDVEKLGELYYLGYHDAKQNLDALKAYLAQ